MKYAHQEGNFCSSLTFVVGRKEVIIGKHGGKKGHKKVKLKVNQYLVRTQVSLSTRPLTRSSHPLEVYMNRRCGRSSRRFTRSICRPLQHQPWWLRRRSEGIALLILVDSLGGFGYVTPLTSLMFSALSGRQKVARAELSPVPFSRT